LVFGLLHVDVNYRKSCCYINILPNDMHARIHGKMLINTASKIFLIDVVTMKF